MTGLEIAWVLAAGPLDQASARPWVAPLVSGLAIAASYLAGSIPFGLLVGLARGIDVRKVGSGNIGATNVGRIVGLPFGFLVFGLDFLKGFAPVLLATRIGPWLAPSLPCPFLENDLPVLCGLAALLGHTFPVWLRFRGGKGGATGLGVGSVLAPVPMLIALAAWLMLVLLTRYVSLGTMGAALTFCIVYFASAAEPWGRGNLALSLFAVFALLLVIVRHRANLVRLIRGTESKVGSREPSRPAEQSPPSNPRPDDRPAT